MTLEKVSQVAEEEEAQSRYDNFCQWGANKFARSYTISDSRRNRDFQDNSDRHFFRRVQPGNFLEFFVWRLTKYEKQTNLFAFLAPKGSILPNKIEDCST